MTISSQFSRVSAIIPEDKSTWLDKIFLTVDIEWASDEVLSYLLNILDEYQIPATFLVTHQTKLLSRILENPLHDIGIHPNFNFLLNGDSRNGNTMEQVLDMFFEIVPDAVASRSHSLTYNSHLRNCLVERGVRYELSQFIPYSMAEKIKPWWSVSNKLISVPFIWADDAQLVYDWDWDPKILARQEGLTVLDVHPIHVYLNSENVDRYERTKGVKTSEIDKCRNKKSYGIENFIRDYIESII